MKETDKLQIKALLSNKSYLAFWFATSFSMTASNLIQFVLSLYVLEKTGSATIFASMLSIIIIPRLFFTPISGVMGDRLKRLTMMKLVMFISCVLLLGFSIKASQSHDIGLLWIYVLVVCLEMIEVFYQAAEGAILPEIVSSELLTEAVSMAKVDDGVVYVASPALGTLMYNLFGLQGGLWLTTILFFLSFCISFYIRTPYALSEKKEEKKNYFREFKEGIAVIQDNPFLKRFLYLVPLFNFFFSSVYTITIAHAFLVSLDVGETAYGIYRSVTASMVIIVPLLVIPIVKKMEMKQLVIGSSLFVSIILLITGLLVWSVEIFGMHIKYYVLVGITILDCLVIAAMMPVHMSISIFYQKTIPNEYRSRVLSVLKMFSMASIPLGNMFFGMLTDALPAYVNIFIAMIGTFSCYLMYRKVFKYL